MAEKFPQLDCHFVSVHVSESYVHQHELVGSAAFSLLALFTLLDGLLSVICVVSFSRAVLLKEHQERFHDHFAVFYNEDLWTVTLTFLLLYIRLPAFVNPSIFFSFPIALDCLVADAPRAAPLVTGLGTSAALLFGLLFADFDIFYFKARSPSSLPPIVFFFLHCLVIELKEELRASAEVVPPL